LHRASDTLDAFLDRRIGQTNDGGSGETAPSDIDFNLDGDGLDAVESHAVELRNHQRDYTQPAIDRDQSNLRYLAFRSFLVVDLFQGVFGGLSHSRGIIAARRCRIQDVIRRTLTF